MSTEFIAMQSPPGSALDKYDRTARHVSQDRAVIPATFLDAVSVREDVFIDEQKFTLEIELDDDDRRSWHWVTYASVGATHSSSSGAATATATATSGTSTPTEKKRGSTASRLPVGTVRLVPPPHEPHPVPGAEILPSKEDIAAGKHLSSVHQTPAEAKDAENPSTINPHDEPYVKIGRLATLKAYRKLGLGKLLVDAATDWASQHPEDILPPPNATLLEAARAGAQDSESKSQNEAWKGLVLVHAQQEVEKVYKKWGFVTDEGMGVWYEEGVPHVGMWKRVQVKEK